MERTIAVSGLVKHFGRTRALDGLDLHVAAGEIHGFLGPNGAGKTTTLRVLLGLLRADAGEVRLLGGHPWRDAVRLHRRLAYVPGDVALWDDLTGGETIDLLGRVHGRLDPRRRDELIGRFELDPGKKVRVYSKGNRQKVALIPALASEAELLLLDEPTTGLDPLMEAEFRQCLGERRGQGVTVLLSSHILAEVEALCDRVSIVREGRIVESGTLAELRHLTWTTITAHLERPPDGLAGADGVHGLEVRGTHVSLRADAGRVGEVLNRLTAFGLRDITAQPATLEELFLRHYRQDAERAATR
ncbi:ABC transporter ATP-binding protein [Nonomuraea zeae]|uniref:ABC transporter ATP-binding protein n=1 Tax=Nonomuraea zeae TaxID=1642303 RepID=A0A5S4GTP8_9ACTN|nr:ABC transporter ATP-binding protein [Nonomuraea zeae]TMR36328.1 ABC transporter ATP-binding protein [Nonomuraea zeae]